MISDLTPATRCIYSLSLALGKLVNMTRKEIVPLDYALKIKSLRGQLGLTQIELARRLGVSHITVNRWENGQAKPLALAWQKIKREQLGLEPPHDRVQQTLFQ